MSIRGIPLAEQQQASCGDTVIDTPCACRVASTFPCAWSMTRSQQQSSGHLMQAGNTPLLQCSTHSLHNKSLSQSRVAQTTCAAYSLAMRGNSLSVPKALQ